MSKPLDIVGERYGKLTVMARGEDTAKQQTTWICKCDCGNEVTVWVGNLRNGHTQSCGCFMRQRNSEIHKKENRYIVNGGVAVGYTENGISFLVDTDDLERVKKLTWHSMSNGYIQSNLPGNGGKLSLHRFIMNLTDEPVLVDHINRNKRDNRKENLRLCTYSQNLMNSAVPRNNTSGYKGVHKHPKANRWIASIKVNKTAIYLGSFVNIGDAVAARKAAEKKYFGEFAPKNITEEGGD